MAMTIRVYEVNRTGAVREVRPTTVVTPVAEPESSPGYPACLCPRHRPDEAYSALLDHTSTCDTCRAGYSCATATHLARAWREARR